MIQRVLARVTDGVLCAAMNAIQLRSSHRPATLAEFECYIARCETMTPETFFAAAPPPDSAPDAEGVIRWESAIRTEFPENDRVAMKLLAGPGGPGAPTVIMLHALMSSSSAGYERIGRELNRRGWNVLFVHLPYHYSRTPRGHLNGELAIGPNLQRTGEGLRQAVTDVRQALAWCRARGCREFALWAASYGAWIGALTSFLEPEFRFMNLMVPIANANHTMWKSAASITLRRRLASSGITPELVARHNHLTSPLHGVPRTAPDRIYLVGGRHDRLASGQDIARMSDAWGGARLLWVNQGHFGYRAEKESFAALDRAGMLDA